MHIGILPEQHNPTTAALSQAHRHAFIAFARERDFRLIEDGVQYTGERATPLITGPFVEQLATRGVLVTPAQPFCLGSERAPQAVRVCISAARDHAALERAPAAVRDCLDAPAPTLWRTL